MRRRSRLVGRPQRVVHAGQEAGAQARYPILVPAGRFRDVDPGEGTDVPRRARRHAPRPPRPRCWRLASMYARASSHGTPASRFCSRSASRRSSSPLPVIGQRQLGVDLGGLQAVPEVLGERNALGGGEVAEIEAGVRAHGWNLGPGGLTNKRTRSRADVPVPLRPRHHQCGVAASTDRSPAATTR